MEILIDPRVTALRNDECPSPRCHSPMPFDHPSFSHLGLRKRHYSSSSSSLHSTSSNLESILEESNGKLNTTSSSSPDADDEDEEDDDEEDDDDEDEDDDDYDVNLEDLEVSIINYEVNAPRPKFTVFRICVNNSPDESWFLFRRFADFQNLNKKLQSEFPHIPLALPPNKWYGESFDPKFLSDRLSGLQAFMDAVLSHSEICNSEPVREFLCVDGPEDPNCSEEDNMTLCDALEEQIYLMKEDIIARDAKIDVLQDELRFYREEAVQLRNALRLEKSRIMHSTPRLSKSPSMERFRKDRFSSPERPMTPPVARFMLGSGDADSDAS